MIKYSLEPYPRELYVDILSDESKKNIINKFYTVNGENINPEEFNNYAAGVIRVINKKTQNYGYVVVFRPTSINISNISHEAYHVADVISEDVGLEYCINSGNEHIAYLVGHIAHLIDKGLKRLIKE
jgi:hypothetical protein